MQPDRFGIIPADDLLHDPPGVPGWSENMELIVNDGETAFFMHFSRMVDDPEIWEGSLIVYLGDDQLLASRTFARERRSDVASAGPLTFAPVEPLRAWRLTFDGMARSLSREEGAAGPLAEGPIEPIQVELEITGVAPVWGVGSETSGGSTASAVHDQGWARVHLEQACRVTGELRRGGTVTSIDGMGMRDHSTGPRDYGGLRREAWVNAVFPSGRAFCLLWVEVEGRAPVLDGFVWVDDELHTVSAIDPPPLESALGEPTEFTASFTSPAGEASVEGRMRHSMPLTLVSPCRMQLGATETGPILVEGPASYDWDGETGQGWIERIYYRSGGTS